MNRKPMDRSAVILILAAFFTGCGLAAAALTIFFAGQQYRMLDGICQQTLTRAPGAKGALLEALRGRFDAVDAHFLADFGYSSLDFLTPNGILVAIIAFSTGCLLLLLVCVYRQRKLKKRIEELTGYLEKVNTGTQGIVLENPEDAFSQLQDEIYKTITSLYQTRDSAVAAKRNFADNLSNIAHQLKTPITAISLSMQMMKQQDPSEYLLHVERQIARLNYLEEALLLLSRIDAGTLVLQKQPVDVFTVLTLACDHLQELLKQKDIRVEIPEGDAVQIAADPDWTMEAVMNILKNCLEHAPRGSTLHCSYAENPLYTLIRICDEGKGFSREELPHVFERFYRGKSPASSGVGLGLPLAKELLEMQNGILSASNLPQGGACFDIRFYSH